MTIRDILRNMNGVTTAIVAFIFLAQAMPSLIKNKTQYYLAMAAVVAVIFLDALAHVVKADAFMAFAYCMGALFQILAMMLLVLAVGGLSVSEFRGDIGDVIEVVRRGETRKEVIVPLSDQARQNANRPREARRPRTDDDPQVFKIDDPLPGSPVPRMAPTPPPKAPEPQGPLPLE